MKEVFSVEEMLSYRLLFAVNVMLDLYLVRF